MLIKLTTAGAIAVVLLMFLGPIGYWPWDHDEVHSLVELGHVSLDHFPGPTGQLERMHRLVPIWNVAQNVALSILPSNEWGTRVLPACCGVLVVFVAGMAAARHRGAWCGWSLGVLLASSQTLLWLSQQNRFYSLALLGFVVVLVFTWHPDESLKHDAVVLGAAAFSVLSHNLTLVPIVLAALATVFAWVIGSAPRVSARRAALAAVLAVAIFGAYLRPILAGWVSGGTGGTLPLISFVAQIGIVPIALAGYGAVVALGERRLHAWLLLMVFSLGFVAIAPWVLGNWNPRYGLFFMVPVWFIAAVGVDAVAASLRSTGHRLLWLGVIVMLGLPKLASHFIDGSRHDFRTAAGVVATAGAADPVVSNWPATLQDYLEPKTRQRPGYWVPGQVLPEAQTIVVYASNAWEPVLQIPGRSVEAIGEIGKRRFDEQSHLIRIYRVGPR